VNLKSSSTLVTALATVLFAGALTASAAEWRSLFNGRNLEGWVGVHDAVFEAQDGNLRLVRGMGWLRTEREYGDFILEMEIRPRVERYDSGLFFRVGLEGKPWPTDAWQINLRRDAWGALVKGTKRLIASSVEGPEVEEDAWSKFRLEVRGRTAALDVDGKRVWTFDQIEPARGYIGIQAEERSFDFRNVRLQTVE
jgi:hypothetical protein